MPDTTINPETTSGLDEKQPISKPTQEFLDRAKLELEIRLNLRQEYENLLKIWKETELRNLESQQNEIITKGLQTYFKKWQEEQKPPEPENIQLLLDQEYVTYTIKVDSVNENDEPVAQTFTIRELPQSIEKTFYRKFKGNLLNKVSELDALIQAGMERSFEDRLKAGLELFDESFDVMSDAVVLILNPFGRRKEINKEWVQNNISSDRQFSIIKAQMEVNRLRDFFSKVFTSSQNMMMMKRPSIQTLQTLVD